jgi:4'-phosphopantetheinyl transferase EntD
VTGPATDVPEVAGLLGPDVTVRQCAADADLVELLLPEERAEVARAVRKRRAEFAAGRVAARAALSAIGVGEVPLLPGPERAPLWPAGIVGTIAHTRRRAVAAVARVDRIRGVGLDLEPDDPVEPDLFASILTPDELGKLAGNPEERGRSVRLVFTAKEAVFKALHPLTGVFLEFGDVAVAESDDGTFLATVRREGLPADFPGREFNGRWGRRDGEVFSVLTLPAGR